MIDPKAKQMLAEDLARFYDDPYGYVLWAFPWGEGALSDFKGPRKWQKNYLTRLGEEVKRRGFDGVNPVEPIQISNASGHGIGKAHSLDTIIDTPKGKIRWGDIKAGDFVFGMNGLPTRVLACTNYKNIPMYRVTFDDDSTCEVSSGHLWNVRGRQERRKKLDTWRTLETTELLKLGVRRSNGNSQARQWEIPIQGCAEYPEVKTDLHPYLVGVWLGDGIKGTPAYSKPHTEIKEKLESFGYEVSQGVGDRRRILNAVELFSDDVFYLGSCDRYIPNEYKYNSVENRKHLLQGLLDTDGEVYKSGSIGYSTTSKELLDDVVWLVRSLGGKAQIQPTTKKGYYYSDDGQRIECKDCYRATINMSWNPFTVKHRRDKHKPSEARYLVRWIDSIEPIGNKDAMCISVENPDGLYLANDFIVTHNSTLTAWLIKWIMDTRPFSKGVVTANTADQLKTKTWAELAKWHNMSVTRSLFKVNATKGNMNIVSVEHPEAWRCDAMTCREENSEAFAGLHAATATPFYIFDEASAVPDKIFEVAQGGLTDGEPMFFMFGNPTRNTGFFRQTFGRLAHRWLTNQIDSREVEGTNKKLFEEWANDYGEDSDFFRVRVKGVFPRAAVCQLIPADVVEAAMGKHLQPQQYNFAPKILGVDVAWFGDDRSCIWLRQGLAAKLLWQGREVDSITLAGLVSRFWDEHHIRACFIDAGMGNGVIDQLRALGRSPIPVYFGGASLSPKYANKRAQMWGELLEWLKLGAAIPDDPDIFTDLTAPEYFMTLKGQVQLEKKEDMKKRGLASPDLADGLALTFAEQVAQPSKYEEAEGVNYVNRVQTDYDVLGG